MRLLRLEHPARYHILVGHRYSHWWLTLQSFKAPLVASTLLELLHYSPRILFVVGFLSDITILSTLGVHIYNTSPLLKVWRRHLHVQVGELRYSRVRYVTSFTITRHLTSDFRYQHQLPAVIPCRWSFVLIMVFPNEEDKVSLHDPNQRTIRGLLL